MLEDIERQSMSGGTGAESSAPQPQASNGASVPKMPSPPKVVNAKWSHEPESPNTAIKRSLNIFGGGGGNGGSQEAAKDDKGEGQTKHSLYRTVSMPVQKSNMADRGGNGRRSPQDSISSKPMHLTDSNQLSIEMKLRNMGLSDEKDSRADAAAQKRSRTKPELVLATNPVAEEPKPELMTPQALMEKPPFPVLTKAATLASSQVSARRI